jgi:hypothetical protein
MRAFRRVLMLSLYLHFTQVGVCGVLLAQESARDESKSVAKTATANQLRGFIAPVIKKKYSAENADKKIAIYALRQLQPAKAAIETFPKSVNLTNDAWTYFIDEQPGANWEHDAKIVLVEPRTNEVKEVAVRMPPMNIADYTPLDDNAKSEMEKIRANMRQTEVEKKEQGSNAAARQAIILSGGFSPAANYTRYWNDLSFIYSTLKNKYGYTDDAIHVLYADGSRLGSEDLDGDGVNDIDHAATAAELDAALQAVNARLRGSGSLFFYSTNHGGGANDGVDDATLYLWGELISDKEFAAKLTGVRCDLVVVTMEQCFSGGMLDELSAAYNANPSVTACLASAATHDEVSYACDDEGDYDEFVYHWTSAISGATPAGVVVAADKNGDGVVSFGEAFDYAQNADSCRETPQLIDVRGGKDSSF